MKDSVFKFSLDIHQTRVQTFFNIMRGDTKRRIEVMLTEAGEPYYITDDCYAVFSAEKADGHKIYNDCEIVDNAICYKLTPQTVSTAGLLRCELKLYGAEDALITSPRFSISVDPTINEEDEIEIESADEVTGLTKLIAETQEVKTEIEQKLENGEFVGERGPQGETGPVGPSGPQGERGYQGIKGEAFEYEDFTPEQLEGLKGPKGDKGDKGDKGETGPQGPKGEKGADGVVTFEALTEEQKESLKGEKGEKGETGATGPEGPQGPKGDKGDTGDKGDKGETGATGPEGPQGPKGDKGDTGDKGDKGETGATGATGPKGADGKTPVKGTDYYTEEDKTEMVNLVLAALPYGDEVSY